MFVRITVTIICSVAIWQTIIIDGLTDDLISITIHGRIDHTGRLIAMSIENCIIATQILVGRFIVVSGE
jgi:hypothetical protein